MNFKDTLLATELIIATKEVPLIVGESGIGKTALAKELAKKNNWNLVVIDGNLLKEGEIGGLPTVEDYEGIKNPKGNTLKKITVYAVHTKLQEIDNLIHRGREVLLFIDEINRCEHTVQQELMNLILNREINGYKLHDNVKIMAAMNPSSKYGDGFDYQVVDMDSAQENRFVWLYMDSEIKAWLNWAKGYGIEEKVMEFISTFPEYLHDRDNEDHAKATPRSYERVSKIYKLYKDSQGSIPKRVFLEILKGNLGKKIAQEFFGFIEENNAPLITYEEIFEAEDISIEIASTIKGETHTRLYLIAKNVLHRLEDMDMEEKNIQRLVEFLELYPIDLRLGIMQEIKEYYDKLYQECLEEEKFLELYFKAYKDIKE